MVNRVYIALGSNLGDKEENLKAAIREIQDFCNLKKESKKHQTKAVGGPTNQPDFLNMCIEITTDLSAIELIFRLQEIEHKMGRNREMEGKNGPRPIDIDILLYNQSLINQPHLKIPHPRMHKRSFVLDPLAEIAPETLHPKLKKSIKELQNELRKN